MMNNRRRMRTAVLVLGVSALVPVVASAQEACTTYTVREGDTLGNIAFAAYGTYNYQMIFNANRDAVVSNPSGLAVGLQLILPCEDGRLTPDTELSAVIEAETQEQQANRPQSRAYTPPLKFVSGNGWKPFADESMANGGIFVHMAQIAIQRGGNDRESTMAWVDDWGAHTEVLLPSGAFDVSIAWGMPDCTKLDLLSESSAQRCIDFVPSLPIYETVATLTTLIDSPFASAVKYEELAGATVCMPKDWSIFTLEQVGLVEPFIKMVQPATPVDCAEAVLSGEADIMAIEQESAVDAFVSLGAIDRVVSNPTLVAFTTTHFVGSKRNPRAVEYIEMLNRGLTEMRESGEWYDIIATGLAAYNAQTN